ncbi:hypothetical protein H0H93_007469 [Arthromyces matolae]|nr:hypothetical protein H0H93_007469 [Arthromyces matolae]
MWKTFYSRRERPARIVDLHGNILSPGFIDIQLNGAYNFDFSVYESDELYREGMKLVAERIIETGVTSILPTLITQDKTLYPKILSLLQPFTTAKSATLLGWHAEGPFINHDKRGAHAPPFLLTAPEGTKSFEDIYGERNLAENEDWLMATGGQTGVRMITAAPEIEGVMNAIGELTKRGIVFSIGHSVASSEIATVAIRHGAGLITHLFNAMPQLHHRDPSIIGLLGSSPHLSSPLSPLPPIPPRKSPKGSPKNGSTPIYTDILHSSEAFDSTVTPPLSPFNYASPTSTTASLTPNKTSRSELHLDKGQVADMAFVRPFYGLIVDGVHSHPNSVRLAYSAHPDGCVLITDARLTLDIAQKILDPNLRDGIYEWRDGQRFVKEGYKLYLEGTDTLAGRCLGLESRKGTLRAGADADFVVLDRRGTVISTWVRGKEAWVKGTYVLNIATLFRTTPWKDNVVYRDNAQLLLSILEYAILECQPRNLALVSKVFCSVVDVIIYRTIVLTCEETLRLFHRTTQNKTSTFFAEQVYNITVTDYKVTKHPHFPAVLAICSGIRTLTVPAWQEHLLPRTAAEKTPVTINSSSSDVAQCHARDGDAHRLMQLPSVSFMHITHLRFCEPGDMWCSPCAMIRAFGPLPHLSHLQLARRANANQANDKMFTKNISDLLSSRPRMKMLVVSIFPEAFSCSNEAVQESNVWQCIQELSFAEQRLVLIPDSCDECAKLRKGWNDIAAIRSAWQPADFWQYASRISRAP